MKKSLFILLLTISGYAAIAQTEAPIDTSWRKQYRETATRVNDLVHTKLDVKFDYDNAYLNGKAWITLKPHFYPTDSLTLDAKGMTIHKVEIMKGSKTQPMVNQYDG